MTGERPPAEAMLIHVFSDDWKILPQAKTLIGRRRIVCTRKRHLMAFGLHTPYGWWVAWRRTYDSGGTRWEYDWADQVTGYTEATCHCRRPRRVDPILATMR
jgi:hypothetical protein